MDELRPSGTGEALADLLQQGGGRVLRMSGGRLHLKRPRTGGDAGEVTATHPAHRAVHVSDVKFPAALQDVPAWAALAASSAVPQGTSAVLNAVSRYSTEDLLPHREA